jgi:hypothetical protein
MVKMCKSTADRSLKPAADCNSAKYFALALKKKMEDGKEYKVIVS